MRMHKTTSSHKGNQLLRGTWFSHGLVGGGEGVWKCSGSMSGGKPVWVSVMYPPKARMRWGSVHIVASRPRQETSLSWRSRTLALEWQVRMACWNVSGPFPQRGQLRCGFTLHQEGCVARYLLAARICWILPTTNFPKPMTGCGEEEGGCSY